ncbi:MAG: 1-(5-phosphoribosyl)-5-[(5-phosphoribosylamino)methylideneamino]imidazole-4-carboxamide isomerase [Anaerolineales bacterium]|jgi:phosphoribosylformimino-5-aminoimidazole carboxamide ribotide isomerase
MAEFIVYPAIDLREGQVVRLQQGDPARKTIFGNDPAAAAQRWLEAGASWLHVVNLDGAFGEPDDANRAALQAILGTSAQVQLGGGLRSLESVRTILNMGVQRAVIGTAAIENPELVRQVVANFGAEHLAVGVDAREGRVHTRGWVDDSGIDAFTLTKELREDGVETIIVTDISRDGMGTGVNIDLAQRLARATDMRVIASGGVDSLEDIRRVRRAALPGVIVGRALYDGKFSLEEALQC